VRHDEGGASTAEFVEIVPQAGFGFEVECSGGLIGDDDRRITEKKPLQALPPELGLVVLVIRSSPTRRR
jgi:hypothetical protein